MKDKSHKCDACSKTNREIPACVTACSSDALTFGNRKVILHVANMRLKEVKNNFPNSSIYGKREFGGLRVITILKDKPEKFNLPVGKDAIQIETFWNLLYSLY